MEIECSQCKSNNIKYLGKVMATLVDCPDTIINFDKGVMTISGGNRYVKPKGNKIGYECKNCSYKWKSDMIEEYQLSDNEYTNLLFFGKLVSESIVEGRDYFVRHKEKSYGF